MIKKVLLGLLCVSMILPFTVNAETINSVVEGENSTNTIVTVGEVEVPVYEVEVVWNLFEFNWNYNYDTNEYNWEVGINRDVSKISEVEYFDEELFENVRNAIYTDQTCKNSISNDITYEDIIADADNYYHCGGVDDTNHFHIADYSMGGRIVPYVKWTSTDAYNYVAGKFKYGKTEERCEAVQNEMQFEEYMNSDVLMFYDSTCNEEIFYEEAEYQSGIYALKTSSNFVDLSTERVPDDGRNVSFDGTDIYHLNLYLENKTEPTTKPKSGDKIGTITITIKNN